MLFHRQKLLISLLEALGGEARRTDFQKLLFLLTRGEDVPSYDFVPYKYGCYSFTAAADQRKLAERGIMVSDGDGLRLGQEVAAVEASVNRRTREFVSRHPERGRDLVRKVYQEYPQTAWRSEILDSVITNEETRAKIEAARPATKGAGLATIGYEGKSLETYLNKLLRGGVTVLCDVRRNPLSRKYGFSKGVLSSACENLGIRYSHLPELGIASEERQELRTQADYDALFERYETSYLPHQGKAVERIAGMIRSGERVTLTCYELQPQQCHRHCVAEAVEFSLKDHGVKSLHF